MSQPDARPVGPPVHLPEPYEGLEEVYIAMGSNLGDRAKNIHAALEKMRGFVHLEALSFLYETAPHYNADQPPYYNCAAKVRTILEPDELLRRLKEVEAALGREPSFVRNTPRTIDLDIVFYGSRTVILSTLVIPHPQMHERDFVVGPLMECAPAHPPLTHRAQLVSFACPRKQRANRC